jgi:hypothetical protein
LAGCVTWYGAGPIARKVSAVKKADPPIVKLKREPYASPSLDILKKYAGLSIEAIDGLDVPLHVVARGLSKKFASSCV